MPLEFTFSCPLPNSIHARPANALEEVAARFTSSIVLKNERNEIEANAKSVLSLVSADIQYNDVCRVRILGEDEQQAFTTLKSFIENEFPGCDELIPAIEIPEGQITVPRMLQTEAGYCLTGTPVSRGLGRGKAVILGGFLIPPALRTIAVQNPSVEWKRISDALDTLHATLTAQLRETAAATEKSVLKAHLAIVRDPALSEMLRDAVFSTPGTSAADALMTTCERFVSALKKAQSQYIRERVIDIQDICVQLMRGIYGSVADEPVILTEPSVVITGTLTPSRFLTLDRSLLQGLVLADGGTTSHTVILARSFGIPTLTGVDGGVLQITPGREIIIDATTGILLTQVTPVVARYYTFEKRKSDRRKHALALLTKKEARTYDGKKVTVAANISLYAEAEAAFANYAEGIGLFRTEILFMNSGDAAPSEDEQYQSYLQVVQAAGSRPVTIRTLDIGGDKPVSWLTLPKERNPFLGCRGIRIYPEFPEVIRTQLRAIIRASACGRIRILVPMVTTREEIDLIGALTKEIQHECKEKRIPCGTDIPIGIMVETPAAAFAIGQFAQAVDFFSIGTNDLSQYFFAADRENKKVSQLNNVLNPTFIRLLKKVIDDAHQYDKPVGICGEMAGNLQVLPLLAGLGLDEISCSVPAVFEVKAVLAGLNTHECKNLAAAAVGCASPEEVSRLLAGFPLLSREFPLLDTNLIHINAESGTREEAIKELCDCLYCAGRTDAPQALENDVWRREEVYATDMGYGIAVPHCKTANIKADSIALLKPVTPIRWHPEHQPVNVIILLAIRETNAHNAHMKIFAKLARRIMHEEFRAFLATEENPDVIREFLQQNLAL